MRLWIFAIGYARGTSEGALCDDYLEPRRQVGRNIGFTAVAIEELAVSQSAGRRGPHGGRSRTAGAPACPMAPISCMLDAKGKGMTSERFRRHAGGLA